LCQARRNSRRAGAGRFRVWWARTGIPELRAERFRYRTYTKIHHQAPAESDLERYFQVSPPAIHDMIKTLERNGLIERTPGQARSIRLLVQPENLPRLE